MQNKKQTKRANIAYKQGGRFLGEGSYGQVFDIKNDEDVYELLQKVGIKYQNIRDVRCKFGNDSKWRPVRECYNKLQFMALKYFYIKDDMTQSNADNNLDIEKNMFKQVVDTFRRHPPKNKFNDLLVVVEGNRPIYEVFLEVVTKHNKNEKITKRIVLVPFKKCDGDLFSLILDGVYFTTSEIIDILDTISSFLMTLSYDSLHHNDIKLENVMYKKEDYGYKFYVGDYGMVGDTILGGSPGYFSPFALDEDDEDDEFTREKYVLEGLFDRLVVSEKTPEKTFFRKLTSRKTKKELLKQYNDMESKLHDDIKYQKNDIFCIGMMLLYLLFVNAIDYVIVDTVKELIGDMLFLKPYKPSTLPLFEKTQVFGKHPINEISELVKRVKSLKQQLTK